MRKLMGLALVTAALVVAGCKGPDMDEMMMKPDRPAEYAELDKFLGNWESFGELRMAGADDPMLMAGESTVRSVADGWVLVEDFQGRMNDKEVKGIYVWWYDKAAKRYKAFGVDDYGYVMTMDCARRTKDGVWKCTSKMRDTTKGHTLSARGTMRWTDANTAEWEMKGYVFGIFKVMEMSGTMRKR